MMERYNDLMKEVYSQIPSAPETLMPLITRKYNVHDVKLSYCTT